MDGLVHEMLAAKQPSRYALSSLSLSLFLSASNLYPFYFYFFFLFVQDVQK